MNICDTPRDRVLDRNHPERCTAICNRSERILESRARQRFPVRIGIFTGYMGIRPWLALIGDFVHAHSFLEQNTQPVSKPMSAAGFLGHLTAWGYPQIIHLRP